MARTEESHEMTGWAGWAYFAGFMMMLAGIFQAIAGLVAIFKDGVFVVGSGSLLLFDFSQWGWVHLLIGVLLFFGAFSVFAGGAFGRTLGTMLAGLSAIANFTFFTAYPLWTIIVISIDILIIYALLVHGGELKETR
jgi:hypothetical protein